MSTEKSLQSSLSPLKRAYLAVERLQARVDALEGESREPIAIIGMGCRYPGASGPDAFWNLLSNGIDAVREVPADRWNLDALYDPDPTAPGKMATRWGGFLDRIDEFDAPFFGIAPREAVRMDPQQRLVLEVAWESLEDAGVPPDRLKGSPTAVFIGASTNDYNLLQAHRNQPTDLDSHYSSGIANSVLSGRLSYLLGLTGPSITLDTACSSSLVAVHLACQSLRAGESEMAIAGAVNVIALPDNTIAFSSSSMMAPDGRCKTFDARADGFVRAEGCGVVVLKRLSAARADADRVLAVIRGSCINQDGASSALTAPNGPSQEAVIRGALRSAELSPSDVSYVEAHGTGTSLGDPIEIQALGKTLGQGRAAGDSVWIGSVKTNIGHCEAAAGMAGLTKVILSLRKGEIPASLHFMKPNPHIAWDKYPFLKVAKETVSWKGAGRVAGVSSFGFSGTNAHLIVGESPAADEGQPRADGRERPMHLLPISARSSEALRDLAAAYASTLEGDNALADIAFTAGAGRSHFAHRVILSAPTATAARTLLLDHLEGSSPSKVITGVRGRGDAPRIAFLFTGQGAQYAGMGRELYETQPSFRRLMDVCSEILEPRLERRLLDVIFADDEAAELLNQTVYTQPALFALEVGLAELWRSWGVEPSLLIGHSVGEYAAACVAGVFSVEEGLGLIADRARLMQNLPGRGAMVSVAAGAAQVEEVLQPWNDAVAVACVNGPSDTVVSGEEQALEAALEALAAAGLRCKRLLVSHGFHSPHMDPMIEEFAAAARRVTYSEPRIGMVSNQTGRLVSAGEVTVADYWVRHVRSPVLFAQGMRALAAAGADLFVEVGPHGTLCAMGQECIEAEPSAWLTTLCRDHGNWDEVAGSLARLYAAGVDVNWRGFDRDYDRRMVDVPSYPFQRKRYWLNPASEAASEAYGVPDYGGGVSARAHPATSSGHPLLGQEIRSPRVSEVVFNARFGLASQPWLGDHRVFGTPILPAAGFAEMMLGAARRLLPEGPVAIRNLVLAQALALDETEPAFVQLVASPGSGGCWSIEILGYVGGEPSRALSWITHASADVQPQAATASSTTAPASVPLVLAGATEVPLASLYEQILARGIELGPAFRGLLGVSRNKTEAVGRLRLPEPLVRSANDYELHPVLLDSAFQAAAALVTSGDKADPATFLPTGIDRIVLHSKPRDELVSRVRLRQGAADESSILVLDVNLADDRGRPVAEVTGLRLQRTDARSLGLADHARISRWQYRVDWQPRALDARTEAAAGEWVLASPALVAERVAPEADRLASEYHLYSYCALQPEIDTLVGSVIVRALEHLGWGWVIGGVLQPEALANDLGIARQHRRLWTRLLALLCEQDLLEPENGGYRVVSMPSLDGIEGRIETLLGRHPEGEAELTLVGRASPRLAACLTGAEDPLEVLFPGGSFDIADTLYRRSPPARVLNALARETVHALLDNLPGDRRLRVLEIGAGTGGTTSILLPEFPRDRTEYVYTDISSLFVSRAQERFTEFPFLHYGVLDIERDPAEQGFMSGSFDLVVAANVLHATRDLRSTMERVRDLLSPGGALLLLEGTRPQSWIDVTFGMTEGWWAFTDAERRGDYPLIDRGAWRKLLTEVGFEDVVTIPDAGGTPALLDNAVIVANRSGSPAGVSRVHTYVVFSDLGGTGSRLIDELRREDVPIVEVQRGGAFACLREQRYRLDPTRPEDYVALADALLEKGALDTATVLHLWSLDNRIRPFAPTPEVVAAQDHGVRSVLHLVQALVGVPGANVRLVVGTRRAQPVGGGSVDAAHAPLWGLARVIELEHPELAITLVDLDGEAPVRDASQLRAELDGHGCEPFVAFRRGERFAARLVPAPLGKDPATAREEPRDLSCGTPGLIDSLAFGPTNIGPPGPGEVQIRVLVTGLNFRDVLIVLGRYPDPKAPIGGECAGEILEVGPGVEGFAPGDRVMAMVPRAFATRVNARAEMTARIPPEIPLEAAATIPSAFVTARFGLCELAALKADEHVLIHAAAGGVGQAAVQLARAVGAEIIATAGSPEKRAHLQSQGVRYVLDSRSLDFVDGVRMLTGGAGVDVVLNSLADEFVQASFSLLKRGGRFIELGKRGILSPEEAAAQRRDVAYHIVDLAADAKQDPGAVGKLLDSVVADLEKGTIQPLPLQRFDRREVAEAFRFMAQARHVGKVVIAGAEECTGASRYPERGLRPDATYLITGGIGGLGLEVAGWLASNGVRHIALLSRGEPGEAASQTVAELQDHGVDVRLFRADVADADGLAASLRTLREEMPPLKGVVHGAGLLRDGILVNQSWDRFAEVLAPKVQGAWNLHRLTRESDLDFLVMFSSISAVLGSPGEGNHAAANAFLDSLVAVRRGEGLPAQSINWGVWSEVGAAATHGVDERAEGLGMGSMTPGEGIRALMLFMQDDRPNGAIMPVDWERFLSGTGDRARTTFFAELGRTSLVSEARPASSKAVLDEISDLPQVRRLPALSDWIREKVRHVLALDTLDAVPTDQPLQELGLDSLMAVELRNIVRTGLGLRSSLPSTLVFDYPTITALADHLGREVLGWRDGPSEERVTEATADAAPEPEEPDVDTMMSALEALSDDEVSRALRNRLAGRSIAGAS